MFITILTITLGIFSWYMIRTMYKKKQFNKETKEVSFEKPANPLTLETDDTRKIFTIIYNNSYTLELPYSKAYSLMVVSKQLCEHLEEKNMLTDNFERPIYLNVENLQAPNVISK